MKKVFVVIIIVGLGAYFFYPKLIKSDPIKVSSQSKIKNKYPRVKPQKIIKQTKQVSETPKPIVVEQKKQKTNIIVQKVDYSKVKRSSYQTSRVIDTVNPIVKHCFDREKKKQLSLRGSVVVNFDISKLGKVSNVKIISDSVKKSKVTSCIKRAVKRLRFTKAKEDVKITNIKFTFN